MSKDTGSKQNNSVENETEVIENDINELIEEINTIGEEVSSKVLDKKWITKSDFSSTYKLFDKLNKLGEEAFGGVLNKVDPDALIQAKARSMHVSRPTVAKAPVVADAEVISDDSGSLASSEATTASIPDESRYTKVSVEEDTLASAKEEEVEEEEISEDEGESYDSSFEGDETTDTITEKDETKGNIFSNVVDFASSKLSMIRNKFSKQDDTGEDERDDVGGSFIDGLKNFVGATLQTIKGKTKSIELEAQDDVQKDIDNLVDAVDRVNKDNASVLKKLGTFVKNIVALLKDQEIEPPIQKLNILDYLEAEDDMYASQQQGSSLVGDTNRNNALNRTFNAQNGGMTTHKRAGKTIKERIKNISRAKGSADKIVVNYMPIKIGIRGDYSYKPQSEIEKEYCSNNGWIEKCATEYNRIFFELVSIELAKMLLIQSKHEKENQFKFVNVVYNVQEGEYTVQAKISDDEDLKSYVVPQNNWSRYRFDEPIYIEKVEAKTGMSIGRKDLTERTEELEYYMLGVKNMLMVIRNTRDVKNKVTLFGREMSDKEKKNYSKMKDMINKMNPVGPLKQVRYIKNVENIINEFCYS